MNVHKAKTNPLSSHNIGSCQVKIGRRELTLFKGMFQSLRRTAETRKQDSDEFDTEGEIFCEKESDLEREKKAILNDIAGLSGHMDGVDLGQVKKDAYGREVSIRIDLIVEPPKDSQFVMWSLIFSSTLYGYL